MTPIEKTIREQRLIPVLRGNYNKHSLDLTIEALLSNDVTLVEFTLNNPQPFELIEYLCTQYPSLSVGAGTVLNETNARMAIDAGAKFLVSPGLHPLAELDFSDDNLLVIPGVQTASEVTFAFNNDKKIQKLFPASPGGTSLLRNLAGPFADVSFIPTGGVNPKNAAEFLRAGAIAVGIGSALFTPAIDREKLASQLENLLADLRSSVV